MVEREADGILNPVVMDFGLARESGEGHGLTETGAVMGTPAYMSPEQARGDTRALDRRSDVYSLGATLYDLIVGIPPFAAESIVELLIKVVGEDPLPLRARLASLPPDLETIVMKCLNKEPNQRYDSAKALADDLARYINGEPILGRRLSLIARVQRRVRKHKTLVGVSVLFGVVVLSLLVGSLRQHFAARREQARLVERARLGQKLGERLGQEITKLEWVLRSARQLPLHDLEREKMIVRERMAQLQLDLAENGELSRGLAHYALGRGHMALHEYPQALKELRLARQLGQETPEVHYALGFVLGKHFEQAMYEARLSGGGDWAKKQLKEIEPKYLLPAIESLQKSRAVKLDSPRYLEGLIAYYQRDYEAALENAGAALKQAPWIYEAHKLAGDVHLERALQARDSGKYEEAEKEFAGAVKSFEAAAAIGQSDGEVYEGLAESWVRQIEMALNRGQPTEAAYAAAVAAADKSSVAEPRSIGGPLKKAFASMMTMAIGSAGLGRDRVQQCLSTAEQILLQQPNHPYASDVASICYVMSAERALSQGGDPEPFLRKGLTLLEPALQQFPFFLWGWNDLATIYLTFGMYAQLHGREDARALFEKSLRYRARAISLDPTYLLAWQNALGTWPMMVAELKEQRDIEELLAHADDYFAKCKLVNEKWQQCYNNYFQIYVRVAQRLLTFGADVQPHLERAATALAALRNLGGSFLDAEQHDSLLQFILASYKVQCHENPEPALKALRTALKRCFGIAAEDVMCRTLDAQAEWIASDWMALKREPVSSTLRSALSKAEQATRGAAAYPDALQVLAETHLRLARAELRQPRICEEHLQEGRAAVEKVFIINPNHALGRATLGALDLLRAQTLRDPAACRASAHAAVLSLQQALRHDPFLSRTYAPLLRSARELDAELGSPCARLGGNKKRAAEKQ